MKKYLQQPIETEVLEQEPEVNLKISDIEDFRDYAERHIYVNFDITEDLINVSRKIMRYNYDDRMDNIPIEEREPIYLYIYSHGGDAAAINSAISICETSQTPIITVNMGVAMSAGLMLLLAGHKRYALKRSRALLHKGSGAMMGSHDEIGEQYKTFEHLVSIMREDVLNKTKIDSKLFHKNQSREWYISDQEQVELGIVDKIVDNIYEIV